MRIYVDGSYYDNLNIAGFAFCVVKDEEIKFTYKGAMVINRGNSIIAELLGVIKALEYCNNLGVKEVTIIHDYNEIPMLASFYRNTKNPYINSYAKKLRKLYQQLDVSFVKVKAHKNDRFNNYVDEMSRKSVEEYLIKKLKKSKYYKK
ncbi:ribonuclease HI [Thermosipho japonicus]|uniref:Ribonuclease HI n=1 Tax=Thermosipho japonicus TaxID=90323 RepID=A0A841GV75_9BACT|nr:RNase H family protein [Thermosipho japonicus]MBB6062821.1 ribonuclease HI [Thermosipho japonicus]